MVLSVISVFDGVARELFDGWIGVGRVPTRSSMPSCSRPSRTLRAAKAVARRRAILDRRCARRHARCAGRDGRMAPVEQKDGGLPTSASRVLWRTREAEAAYASRRAHQFQKYASYRLPQFESRFVLFCFAHHIVCTQFGLLISNSFVGARIDKLFDLLWRWKQIENHRKP